MKTVAEWYLGRALRRISFEASIYGSCHTQLKPRTSRFMRWLLGPYKYVFVHPANEICQCNWRNGATVQSLCKGKTR